MKFTPLSLSILTTTLISGVAIAFAWIGPVGTPFLNNTAAPVNVGGIDQTKSGAITSNGLISLGGLKIGLSSTLGSLGANRGYILDVIGGIGSDNMYSYGNVCTGNTLGNCTGTGGVVLGGANTAANVNITNTGNSFFNAGNVGIGTNTPTQKLSVTGNIQAGSSATTYLGSAFTFAAGFRHMILGTTYFDGTNFITPGVGSNAISTVATDILGIAFYTNTSTGATNRTDTPATFNGFEKMRIANTGNVGIGTTTPASKLSVAGEIYSGSGGFRFPDGTTQATAAPGAPFRIWQNYASPVYGVGIGADNTGSWARLYGFMDSTGTTRLGGFGGLGGINTLSTLWIGTDYNNASVIVTPSNKQVNIDTAAGQTYFGFAGGNVNYLRGATTYFNGSLVDENNAGYYLNPDGLSVLNRVFGGELVGNYNSTDNYRGSLRWAGVQLGNNGDNRIIGGRTGVGGNLKFYVNNTNDAADYSVTPDGILALQIAANGAVSVGSGVLAPRLGVNATGLISGANQPGYDIGAGMIAAGKSVYSYDKICAGNSNGTCEGTGGMVMSTANIKFPDGTTQTTAAGASVWTTSGADIYNSNTGAVGIGGTPGWGAPAKLTVTTTSNPGFAIRSQSTGNRGFWTTVDDTNGIVSLNSSYGTVGAYPISFQVANVEAMRVNANATVGVNSTLTANQLSTAAGSHLSYGGTTNYLRGNTYNAGVLYDENNSAYYIDGNATSIFNDLRANILYDQGDTAYYVDPNAVSSVNDLRANIIYDRSNTGYYVDPASTSNLNALNVQAVTNLVGGSINSEWYRTSGNGGWFSNTHGGGIYMADPTWIRTFGSKAFYHDAGPFRTDGTLQVGSGGATLSVPNGGNTAVGYGLTVATTGTFGGNVTAPAFIYSSDERLKDNITRIDGSLDKVRRLEGYTFNWKKDGRTDVGLVAQQVETVFPELVHTDSVTGLKAVEYGNLVAPLIEAVKELANSLDALATRVFNTETRQSTLEKQNQVQTQQIAELQRQINEIKNK